MRVQIEKFLLSKKFPTEKLPNINVKQTHSKINDFTNYLNIFDFLKNLE